MTIHQTTSRTRHHRCGESRHNMMLWSASLVAPMTPDNGAIRVDMAADNGVIGGSVTAVIAGPITIAISRVAIAVRGIGRGVSVTIAVSGIAVTIAVIRITVAVAVG